MSTAVAAKAKAVADPLVSWEEPAAELQKLSEDYGPTAMQNLGHAAHAFRKARGMELVYAFLEKNSRLVMRLVGTSLGFKTDKDSPAGGSAYDEPVIIRCATDAIMRGLHLVGNEFNIISARCYTTQEGYARLVKELPGLTDLKLSPAVPKLHDGGATVAYTATWKLNGQSDKIETVIPVKVNAGMGSDAILGKAKRKVLARVHSQVTCSEQSANDAAADEPVDDSSAGPPKLSKTADLAARLGVAKPVVTVEVATPIAANGALFDNGTSTPD